MFNLQNTKVVEIPLIHMDTGAPMPVLFRDGFGNLQVVFHAFHNEEEEETIQIVKFNDVSQYKFGGPNDEVLLGHPYYKLGLKHYSFFEIINSEWIQEIKKIYSVHSRFDGKRWEKTRHFIITFHDETFECIAEEFQVSQEKNTVEKKYLELVSEYAKPSV